MVFISLSVNAQKSGLAKPVGNKLQPPVENKMPWYQLLLPIMTRHCIIQLRNNRRLAGQHPLK